MSPRALSTITSSFILVLDYQRTKHQVRGQEFSKKAITIDLIREHKVGPIQIASELELTGSPEVQLEQDKFPEIFAILDQGGNGRLLD
jgi:hypothetical protein